MPHTWLTRIPYLPAWTGWHTMQALAQHTGHWNP